MTPPTHLDMEENIKPIEENGFILADFTPEAIRLRFFRFNYHENQPEAIDTLKPFRVSEIRVGHRLQTFEDSPTVDVCYTDPTISQERILWVRSLP